MPLVVPGIMTNNPADKTEQWSNKLVGKKLSDDTSNETVSADLVLLAGVLLHVCVLTCSQLFCKKDLPEECRILQPGAMATRDLKPDRLNVHLMEDGSVSHVTHG